MNTEMKNETEINNNINVDEIVVKKARGRPKKDPTKSSRDKEQLQTYQKEYYNKNKDKLLKALNTPVKCDRCNCTVTKVNLLEHKNSKKCNSKIFEKQYKEIEEIYKQINLLNEQYKTKKDELIFNQIKTLHLKLKKL